MKKPVLLGLAISLALGVTACSSQDKGQGSNESSVSSQQNGQNDDSKNDANKKESTNKEEKFIYGKVKSVVGNEIEFELAKDPGTQIEGEEKEENKGETKEETPAATLTPSMEAKPGEDQKVSVGEIEKNKPLVELEFTGDTKTITIPTGVNISILSGRSGEGLTAIKEGTYLQISVDDDKSENPNILSVNVIS
ncbi:hypothetical protein CHL78_004835 [Romboutsia weinsteinii]|uniref:Lipoprotein n=1 Tax=Romboutsia weinsteinii TaxID=2020949 RepID=A0A371J701_9FIRM|nr:hypothetical protein [Romboutsia weinsteinii]RDY28515.1 hypothetical protein CHL78_004835 [Romboutsia weinsteinii]